MDGKKETPLQILQRFEMEFHGEVYNWIGQKAEKRENLEILDISIDHAVFTSILSEKLNAQRIVSAIRKKDEKPVKKSIEVREISLEDADYSSLESLGKFDIIVLREMLHEVQLFMKKFFETLKKNLRGDKSMIIVVTRPKNPPVPIPDSGMVVWRKTSPTRELIIDCCNEAGYRQECYAVSCPITVSKADWSQLLKGRFFAALKNNLKCSDREINEFVRDKPSPTFEFEEKILIMVLQVKQNDEPTEDE